MRARQVRKAISFGFGTVAAGLVLASAAYGCTIYKGFMTVTGVAGTVSTARGDGATSTHEYCSLTRGAVGHGQVAALPPSIVTVEVAPSATDCIGNPDLTNRLDPLTTYTVTFKNSTSGIQWSATGAPLNYKASNSANLCQLSGSALLRPAALGGGTATFTTDANGAGSVVAQLPATALTPNGLFDDSAICVVGTTGTGNMVPIHIV